MVYVSRSFCHKRRVSSADTRITRESEENGLLGETGLVVFSRIFSGKFPISALTQRIRRCEIAGDMLGHLSWNSSSGTGVRPRIFPHVRNFVNANLNVK